LNLVRCAEKKLCTRTAESETITACQNPHSRAVGTTMRRKRSTAMGRSHCSQCANAPRRTTDSTPRAHSRVNKSACEPVPRTRRAPRSVRIGMEAPDNQLPTFPSGLKRAGPVPLRPAPPLSPFCFCRNPVPACCWSDHFALVLRELQQEMRGSIQILDACGSNFSTRGNRK